MRESYTETIFIASLTSSIVNMIFFVLCCEYWAMKAGYLHYHPVPTVMIHFKTWYYLHPTFLLFSCTPTCPFLLWLAEITKIGWNNTSASSVSRKWIWIWIRMLIYAYKYIYLSLSLSLYIYVYQYNLRL